ncbi:RdRP-domain-containing protein [Macrolepiota fuliginosa MF-IS2]|uniref:RNA-dependent RNA polymerase n=1 Tax=Macrolepiota fuliginosa MF-IS2 TaxID=1400762 RepID=A0A9P5XGU1_9AGAR|nr:RdRP-domain-containing protein [Macrolepiota fuliginosa MF-IS2]
MEIFMRNIPLSYDKHQVKMVLAGHLHSAHLFGAQVNFDVYLHPPRVGIPTRTGAFTLTDPRVGGKFLSLYGSRLSPMHVTLGTDRLEFSESNRAPRQEVLELLTHSPWVDPVKEREQEQREEGLSQMFVSLQSIQFGWMCRDDVFSIESEARQPALFRFDPRRRELNVSVKQAYNDTSEYVIAIRQSSIMNISSHQSLDGAQRAVIFLQLEIPPWFFQRPIPVPGAKKQEPYQRLTTFPVVNNPGAIPYTSLAIRLILRSPAGTEAFAHICEAANLRNLLKSYPIRVARRDLFSSSRLQMMDIAIRQFEWSVAFQLEALVRNLYVDATEVLSLIPKVQTMVASRGRAYVAKLLKQFAPRAKDFLYTDSTTTILPCFDSFAEEFSKQGNIEPDIPEDPNFYSSLHVMVTPTSMFLTGPFVDKSNRVIRRYDRANQDSFLRVEFREDNNLQFRFDRDVDSLEFIKRRIGPIMHEGLLIAGRKFRFLAYSQSALKEHSVWFVKVFNDSKHGIVTAAKIISSLGNFRGLSYDTTLEFCPARLGARVSQAFSATDAAVVEVDEILIDEDIETGDGKYVFTDGSGGMSEELAREIWRLIGRKRDLDEYPHAYQIRFQGSKGMLSVDYTLNGSNALSLRPSMIKFDAPGSTEIEISRAIDQPTTYYLNRPLIMILEGLGVPYEVFKGFQDQAVRETKAATRSLSAAAHLLQTHGLGLSFKLPSVMVSLGKLDLEVLAQDPFFDQLLRLGIYHVLRDLKHRARIPIPNAWTLVGVADTHGYLRKQEVFVCVRHREKGTFYLDGPVLISRSPTIHPGDVQLAMAIGKPERGSPFVKEALPNTVVFSVQGERPLPTCLGGGDLDGDLYNIIPLKDHPYFAPKHTFPPADYLPAQKEFTEWPCTMKDVADFVMKYIVSDVLGVVATNWLIIADQQGNITNKDCILLAKLHSDAVDYQKTGRQVPLEDIPKARFPRPDWNAPETIEGMAHQDTKYYKSETALGKLTRAIDLKAHEPSLPPRVRPRPRRGAARTAAGRVESLADDFSGLGLGNSATSVIFENVELLVVAFINPHVRIGPRVSDLIATAFGSFAEELRSITSRYSLSHRFYKPLTEEELIVGTIVQKTSQPGLRKEKIAKLKDATDYAFKRVKEALEGERPAKEYLQYAWNAWKFSITEMRKETFGAKAFWWITLGAVFDALKLVEEATEVRSTRGSRA